MTRKWNWWVFSGQHRNEKSTGVWFFSTMVSIEIEPVCDFWIQLASSRLQILDMLKIQKPDSKYIHAQNVQNSLFYFSSFHAGIEFWVINDYSVWRKSMKWFYCFWLSYFLFGYFCHSFDLDNWFEFDYFRFYSNKKTYD